MKFISLLQCTIIYGNSNGWSNLINWKLNLKKFKNSKYKYITMMITATKAKTTHIPDTTPAPPRTYTGPCPTPHYLTSSLQWMSAPLSNSTSTMERCPFLEATRRAVYPPYTTQTDTVRFSSTSSYTHRLQHSGIQDIQNVGVPVMETVRNNCLLIVGIWKI